MHERFKGLPVIVKFLLLFIPPINWICEIMVRIGIYKESKNTSSIIGIILAILLGYLLAYIDAIVVLARGDVLTFRS